MAENYFLETNATLILVRQRGIVISPSSKAAISYVIMKLYIFKKKNPKI